MGSIADIAGVLWYGVYVGLGWFGFLVLLPPFVLFLQS